MVDDFPIFVWTDSSDTVDFVPPVEGFLSSTVVIPTYAGERYILFARVASAPVPTSIVLAGWEAVGQFSVVSMVDRDGVSYNVWRTSRRLSGELYSGRNLTVRSA